MAGRHRAERSRAQGAVPARRGRPAGITDARDAIEHLVTDESIAQHRHSGNYLALCGARVLAASLTAPSRRRCGNCVIKVVSR